MPEITQVTQGAPWGPSPGQLEGLRRPFTPEAIRFKAQVTGDSGGSGAWAIVVAYIDARLVIERLNAVVGGHWRESYPAPGPDGTQWCELEVCGQVHRDVGEGKGKGVVSDALKRVAVRFGIGVSVYAVPRVLLSKREGQIKITTNSQGKKTTTITEDGEALCRQRYEEWLEGKGIASFGKPMDHGDVIDSAGDVEASSESRPRDEEKEELDKTFDREPVPEATRRLVEKINLAYAALPTEAKPLIAVHNQTLKARHALGDSALEEYLRELEELGS